ncbi:hypothetical protein NW845_01115 [Synechococcus sp. H60.2]|uniref:hypothetical protein n=1 Tax=Synechococcus sp. H60.2 TaxID=2964518 RepID=UPI0039C3F975
MVRRRLACAVGSLALQRSLQTPLQQRSRALNRRRKLIYCRTRLLYQRNLPLYLRNLLLQYRTSFIYNLKARPVIRTR